MTWDGWEHYITKILQREGALHAGSVCDMSLLALSKGSGVSAAGIAFA